MAEYGSQDVICPYYKSETDKTINCEGVINKTCSQPFRSKKKKNAFKEKYCCCYNFKNCPYCKMLEKNYK